MPNIAANQKQSGAVMILAIMLMSFIATVSLAISIFVLSEIRQTSRLYQSVYAYYAAETGIEKSLYEVRKENFTFDQLNDTTRQLNNESSYTLATQDNEDTHSANIMENKSYQLDLFNPNSLDPLEDQIQSIYISWVGNAYLEVNWLCWDSTGNIGNANSEYMPPDWSTGHTMALYSADCYLYRLRMIPRNCDSPDCIVQTTLTAYSQIDPNTCEDGPDPVNPVYPTCRVPIPARVIIKSSGRFPASGEESSYQAIQISMPQRESALFYFDYVLFSENILEKDTN